MRKLILISSFTLILYIVGFFLILPVAMKLTEEEASIFWIGNVGKLRDIFYQDWIIDLDRSNPIRVLWNKQGFYWCNRFETCTIEGG